MELLMNNFFTDLTALVEINLKVRYRKTLVGFLWVILNPLLLFCVQALLFSRLLNAESSSYLAYLVSGLIPWFFVSQTAEMSCNYLSTNTLLIKNLNLHPLKLIASLAVENFVSYFIVSLLVIFYVAVTHSISLLFLINYILASSWILILVISLGFICSLINIIFKDTKYILHFIFTILYFLTPTFFYTSSLPLSLQNIIFLNPFYWMISLFRAYDGSQNLAQLFLINAVIMIFLILVSFWSWKKFKNKIYLRL